MLLLLVATCSASWGAFQHDATACAYTVLQFCILFGGAVSNNWAHSQMNLKVLLFCPGSCENGAPDHNWHCHWHWSAHRQVHAGSHKLRWALCGGIPCHRCSERFCEGSHVWWCNSGDDCHGTTFRHHWQARATTCDMTTVDDIQIKEGRESSGNMTHNILFCSREPVGICWGRRHYRTEEYVL